MIFSCLVSIQHRPNERTKLKKKPSNGACLIPLILILSIYFKINLIFFRFPYFWPSFWNTIQNEQKQRLIRRFRFWLGWASAFHWVYSSNRFWWWPFFSLVDYIYTIAHTDIIYTLLCNQMLLVNSSYKSQREGGGRWSQKEIIDGMIETV